MREHNISCAVVYRAVAACEKQRTENTVLNNELLRFGAAFNYTVLTRSHVQLIDELVVGFGIKAADV